VDHPPAVIRVGSPLEDPSPDQLCQSIRQNVASDPEAGLELLEMLEAVECAAKDQERPFLADQLDCGRNRARQSSLPERVQMSRQRIARHRPFSPQSNLFKAQ